MSIVIRSMRAADVDRILEMERRTDGAAHWPRDIYLQMLHLATDSPIRKLALVVEQDGDIAGCVVGRIVLDEAELENIFVDTNFRRQGIASALVTAFADACRKAGAKQLRLEVREGNDAARSFYQRAGFVIAGRRARYYLEPEEDALLLSLKL
jgi:[ribosomal protein S18]-alanine N-acetyltransferase